MHSEVAAVGRDGIVGRAIDVQGAAWRKIKDRNEPFLLEVGAAFDFNELRVAKIAHSTTLAR
jgi:hypothetical protein